jgi:predicted permease
MAAQLEAGPDLFGQEHPNGFNEIVGRLRPGLSAKQAKAALTGWSRQITADRPDSENAVGAILNSRATAIPLTLEMLALFIPLVVAFGLVLLLACANVANIMLARAMARQREIGIRLSLGAGRRRLIRQLLTESILLAIPAGLAGFVISQVTLGLGVRLMFATLPSDMAEIITTAPTPPDGRVFGFILVASLVSAVLFGLAPAIQSTRDNVMLAARGEFTSDVRPVRLRNMLVIGQITASVLLLICSGILIRAADRMRNFELGYKTRGVIIIGIEEKFRPKIIERLSSEPMIQTFAAAATTPLNGMLPTIAVSAGSGETAPNAWYNFVSPEYFSLLEIPILRGRNFTANEASSQAPLVIVSERTARRLWPNRDAVGQEIRIQRDADTYSGERLPKFQTVRVIGVSRDIVTSNILWGKDPTLIYFPISPASARNSLLIRVKGDAEPARRKLDAELAAMAPGAVQEIHPLDQYLAGGIYPFRAASWIGSALGVLALLLTLSGIYGVLSYLIAQRTKEVGIRVALGATTGAVTRMVLEQSMRLAAIGIGLGTVLSLGVSRLLTSLLTFMNTFDALAYGGGVLLVAFASLAAAYFPSRRAARIDPITTLRCD